MARTVDLFIHHDDLHQMLALVGTAVHRPPTRTDDDRWSVRLADGVVGDLGPACSGAGGGPRFVPFEWQLSARSESGVAPGDDPVTAAMRVVAGELRRQKLGCLLVLDLQHDRRRADARPVEPHAEPHAEPAGLPVPDGPGALTHQEGPAGAPEPEQQPERAVVTEEADEAAPADGGAGGEPAGAADEAELPERPAAVAPIMSAARRGRSGRREGTATH